MAIEVFISYASEDQRLVDAVALALSGAFQRSIRLTYMSEFQLGTPFREKIDEAIDKADVLLAIASGRSRLTFTFTGYEVGYFRRSQKQRPLISGTPPTERVLIPFAILTGLPSTISEFEGIEITDDNRPFVLMNERGLTDDDPEPVIYKLFTRLDQLVESIEGRQTDTFRSALVDTFRQKAEEFNRKLYDVIRLMPINQDTPKTKITIRIAPDFNLETADLGEFDTKLIVIVTGPTHEIFSDALPMDWIPWSRFIGVFGKEREVALSWIDTITRLMRLAVKGDFSDSDQIVLSHDSQNLFRLFISKSTTFYDQSRQLEFYVVQIFQLKDVGDPFTSYLGKALEVALRYRSLFLEANSPFTPTMFTFVNPKDIKTRVSELLKELRILFVREKEARLEDGVNILALFGAEEGAAKVVQDMMKEWSFQKEQLNVIAESFVRTFDPTQPDDKIRSSFISQLQVFRKSLTEMNTRYLQIVIDRLSQLIDGQAKPSVGEDRGARGPVSG
jgi:TIR domain